VEVDDQEDEVSDQEGTSSVKGVEAGVEKVEEDEVNEVRPQWSGRVGGDPTPSVCVGVKAPSHGPKSLQLTE
jgi:hypothetical protein